MKSWSEAPAYTHKNPHYVDTQELHSILISDLEKLGVDTSGFTLVLRNYSKTRYGTYNSKTKVITLYVYTQCSCCIPFTYKELFNTLLHEVVHFIQWTDPKHVRWKGIMHDADFYIRLNALEERAESIVYRRDTLVS